MKKLILAVLIVLLIPAFGFCGMLVQNAIDGATECSTSTDYIGFDTLPTDSTGSLSEDTWVVFAYTPVCDSGCSSGSLVNAYAHHNSNDSENVKVCIWNKDGASPSASDTLIECVTLSSGGTLGWINSASAGSSITCATTYWVGVVSDSTTWARAYNTSGKTAHYKLAAGFYATPGALSTEDGNTANREYGIYFSIGP